MDSRIIQTFKRGSKTYFYSSIFFPRHIRDRVFSLYAFVRKADDFVDTMPQDREGFYRFVDAYRAALDGKESGDIIIDSFVSLKKSQAFPDEWVNAFLQAMELDLTKDTYHTIEETIEYMYGSAEVIGLFLSSIFGLPEEAYPFAQMQGRAMQFINFIRDIDEDNVLGRRYLPLSGTSLASLDMETAFAMKEEFTSFVRAQIDLYRSWQDEAEKGYRFIPKRYLIPVKTASDMYNWTGRVIYKDPAVVFNRKVKPGIGRIVGTIIKNSIMI